jgi:hypothetical protein
MARNKSTTGKAPAGKAVRAGRSKSEKTAASAAVQSGHGDADLQEWDEVQDDLPPIPDIDGMIGKPAANQGNDPMTRRRIEMLREERMLARALSDGFDL